MLYQGVPSMTDNYLFIFVVALIIGLIAVFLPAAVKREDRENTRLIVVTFLASTAISVSYTVLDQVSEFKRIIPVLEESGDMNSYRNLVRARSEMSKQDDTVLLSLLEDYNRTHNGRLKLAGQDGFISVPAGEEVRSAERVINTAKTRIDATSYVTPSDWWAGPEGQSYMLANKRLASNGVKIRRIFIVPSKGDISDVQEYLNCNSAAGMEVLIVEARDIEGRARGDVVVIDEGKIAGRMTLNAELEVTGLTFSSRPDFVERQQDDFRRILQVATIPDLNPESCTIVGVK